MDALDAALVSLARMSRWRIFFFFNLFLTLHHHFKVIQKGIVKRHRNVLLSSCMEQSRFNTFQKDTLWVIAGALHLLHFDGKKSHEKQINFSKPYVCILIFLSLYECSDVGMQDSKQYFLMKNPNISQCIKMHVACLKSICFVFKGQ